jgi:hypothetical protein
MSHGLGHVQHSEHITIQLPLPWSSAENLGPGVTTWLISYLYCGKHEEGREATQLIFYADAKQRLGRGIITAADRLQTKACLEFYQCLLCVRHMLGSSQISSLNSHNSSKTHTYKYFYFLPSIDTGTEVRRG